MTFLFKREKLNTHNTQSVPGSGKALLTIKSKLVSLKANQSAPFRLPLLFKVKAYTFDSDNFIHILVHILT